jgi:hypothetical protein
MQIARVMGSLSLLATACAGQPRAAEAPVRPSDVVELSAPGPGYALGKALTEGCSGQHGLREIGDEALAAVDCSAERVTRVLHARASELDSYAIVGKRCRTTQGQRYTVSCSAHSVVRQSSVALELPSGRARSAAGPAPSPAQVQDLDEPDPRQSTRIRVSFSPRSDAVARPARSYDRVAETRDPAVGRKELGQVAARCDGCDDLALHHALRVTAGRMGAGEIASVRCFDEGDRRCVATALEPWSY